LSIACSKDILSCILPRSSSEDLHEKTNDFFWNGPLDDHFRGLFGEEKGNQIMDQALAYLDSLFE
jgi:hypothetical protein